jgi:hypothetical protein
MDRYYLYVGILAAVAMMEGMQLLFGPQSKLGLLQVW